MVDRLRQRRNRCPRSTNWIGISGLFDNVRGAGSVEWIAAGATLLVLAGAVGKMMITQSERGADNVGVALLAAVGLDEGGASTPQPAQHQQGSLPSQTAIQNAALPNNEGGFTRKPGGELVWVDPDGTERATSMDEAGNVYIDGPDGWTLAEVPALPGTESVRCQPGTRCIDFGQAPSGPEWEELERQWEQKQREAAAKRAKIEEALAQVPNATAPEGQPSRYRCPSGQTRGPNGRCGAVRPPEQNADDPSEPAFSAQDALDALTNEGGPTEDEQEGGLQADLDRASDNARDQTLREKLAFEPGTMLSLNESDIRQYLQGIDPTTDPARWAQRMNDMMVLVQEATGHAPPLDFSTYGEDLDADRAERILRAAIAHVLESYENPTP